MIHLTEQCNGVNITNIQEMNLYKLKIYAQVLTEIFFVEIEYGFHFPLFSCFFLIFLVERNQNMLPQDRPF